MDRRDAGGIAGAAALLSEHGGAIEADLQRYYGLHLGDFPWPLTARRLTVLLQSLPEDSAFNLGLLPEDARTWSLDRSLLASVVDELRISTWQRAVINGAKGMAFPTPIPRPGTSGKPRRSPVDQAKIRAALADRGISIPDELRGG